MSQQIINNGESGLVVRTKLNDMFSELYGNTAVPVKMPAIGANTTQVISANTFLQSLEVVKVSGTPILKIGTSPGGEELFPQMEITGFSQSNAQLYCPTDTTLYFTISGGVVNIRLDVINNYF